VSFHASSKEFGLTCADNRSDVTPLPLMVSTARMAIYGVKRARLAGHFKGLRRRHRTFEMIPANSAAHWESQRRVTETMGQLNQMFPPRFTLCGVNCSYGSPSTRPQGVQSASGADLQPLRRWT